MSVKKRKPAAKRASKMPRAVSSNMASQTMREVVAGSKMMMRQERLIEKHRRRGG